MTLIPMNIHLKVSTKFRQINSPMQIQWLFIAPTGKGNMYRLAAGDKCYRKSGDLLQKSYLCVSFDTEVVGGKPRGIKKISVGMDMGSPSCSLRNLKESGVNLKLMSLHYQCKFKAAPAAAELQQSQGPFILCLILLLCP